MAESLIREKGRMQHARKQRVIINLPTLPVGEQFKSVVENHRQAVTRNAIQLIFLLQN